MKAKGEITLEFEGQVQGEELDYECRKYRMTMPVNAPLGEAYMAASAFLDEIVRLINENASKMKGEEKEE